MALICEKRTTAGEENIFPIHYLDKSQTASTTSTKSDFTTTRGLGAGYKRKWKWSKNNKSNAWHPSMEWRKPMIQNTRSIILVVRRQDDKE